MHKAPYSLNPYLAICGNLIAEKMDMALIYEWPNANFIRLSIAIGRETKVCISKNTLKRIFGKLKTDESYYPQKATLDALAIFVGYKCWEDLRTKCVLTENKATQPPQAEGYLKARELKKMRLPMGKRLLFVLLAVTATLFTALTILLKNDKNLHQVSLSCLNPEGKNGFSAVFKLDVPKGYTDTSTFTIDFNDRVKMPVTLNNHNIIHHYETPGWYQTVLAYKGKPIDTSIVRVESIGWFAYVNGPPEVYGRKFLKKFDGTVEGMKGFTKDDVAKAGIDTVKPFFLHFGNIKKTNIDGDNFEMLAKVKLADVVENGGCASVHFGIYGDVEDDCIGITSPDCAALADANFSEGVCTGAWNDLRALAKDLGNGGNIKLNVKNKKVKLYVNNKLIYSSQYHNKLGKISGVKIYFSGIGEVYAFSLRDLNSGETF